nr:helix-turn-helix domain-containing protein [uncultured Dongia sp.]
MSGTLRRLSGTTPETRWEAVFAAPDPRLGQIVLGDYQGWVETAPLPVFRRQMPVVMVPVILNFGPSWEVGSPRTDNGALRPFDSFIAGLHDQSADTQSRGDAACLQLNLTPLGAYRLLGLPMHEIANRTLDLMDLLGTAGADLIDQLCNADDWHWRFNLLDAFLLARISDRAPVADDIAWALAQLQRSHGKLAIGRLADDLSVSRKRLINRFHDQIGLPPKTIGRIYRFNRMLAHLQRPKRQSLAELADACGYYDQAHFNRDFRDFAGCAPGTYLAGLAPAAPEMADI